ncbi:hypothetical protein [Candidatus Uabimicrobium amorphum]|uniref:Uncharacterized protein n=1 Tax=Uabimicrobium amorphum TaxID=2596890 RepID=A0A5S9IJ88_UABAM|nr:hypothetical protein [Candidatus Uabimicrobium amorphum]BBM82557.1 hypothetical protein UABAM_00900 [Candidatus Uabimicrobium amorphum]
MQNKRALTESGLEKLRKISIGSIIAVGEDFDDILRKIDEKNYFEQIYRDIQLVLSEWKLCPDLNLGWCSSGHTMIPDFVTTSCVGEPMSYFGWVFQDEEGFIDEHSNPNDDVGRALWEKKLILGHYSIRGYAFPSDLLEKYSPGYLCHDFAIDEATAWVPSLHFDMHSEDSPITMMSKAMMENDERGEELARKRASQEYTELGYLIFENGFAECKEKCIW